MKIQCPCGAKYVIDVTPGMQPVQFICPSCGSDYSDLVNELIQRELGEQIPVAKIAPPPAFVATETPAGIPQAPRLKISSSHVSAPTPPPAPVVQRSKRMTESFAAEKSFWRKAGSIFAVAGVFAVLGIGGWIWYSWFGSVPHVYFSARFDEISHSGSSFVSGDQIVFLHGGTLARYDLKTGKQIWTQQLVTQQQIDDQLKREDDENAKAQEENGRGDYSHVELPAVREKNARIGMESELSLHVSGQNVWVADGDELTRYDWNSGNALTQISAPGGGEMIERGNELLTFSHTADGAQTVVHINLASGELSTNEFRDASAPVVAQNYQRAPAANTSAGGGLPLSPYAQTRTMNPNRVAQQAQNLSPAGKIALPAIIANNSYNQRIEREMNGGEENNSAPQRNSLAAPQAPRASGNFTLIPDQNSFVEFSSQLTAAHVVEREAMKAAPAKSALDDPNLNGSKTGDVANEILNGMQRDNGGDKVAEDESTYRVTIRQPDSSDAGWSGEVAGAPQLFPLKTVNVLVAGKTVIVLDKSNKKLWQTEMTYEISGGDEFSQSLYGDGPCVERDGTLYVFDQAVLAAFDLSNGNARWRIPSVGIVGLFFDDANNIYVNTTTGNPDDIKYARQIDITKKIENVLLKVDSQTGKILWSVNPHGLVCYLSGKFIYASYSFDPGDEEDQQSDATAGLQNPPFTRISRINPNSGRILWEHDEPRAAMNMQFDGNSIRLIFKKEVEVLRYFAL